MMKGIIARARAVQVLWLASYRRLPTKASLCRLGTMTNQDYVFCGEVESLDHLLFKCVGVKTIWDSILNWLNVMHNPQEWKVEIT